MKPWVILGAGGHAAVVADAILQRGGELRGFLDDHQPHGGMVLGYPVLGKLDACTSMPDCRFVIAIGDNASRQRIAQTYALEYDTVIHPRAVIARDVQIGAGSVIMANAVANARSYIGTHCILNTGCIVEHDNVLENFVHISPAAALGGCVSVGDRSWVGVGACVRNNVSIGSDVMVGAGAAVVKDLREAGVYVGVPARKMSK